MANPIPIVQARFGQEQDLLASRQRDGVDAVALDTKSVWRFIEDIGWVRLGGAGSYNLVFTAVLPMAIGPSAASLGVMKIPGGSLGPRGFIRTTLVGLAGPLSVDSDLTVTAITPGQTLTQTITLGIGSPWNWRYDAIYQNKSEAGTLNQNVTYNLQYQSVARFDSAQMSNDTTHDWTLEYRVSLASTPGSVFQALVEVGYVP